MATADLKQRRHRANDLTVAALLVHVCATVALYGALLGVIILTPDIQRPGLSLFFFSIPVLPSVLTLPMFLYARKLWPNRLNTTASVLTVVGFMLSMPYGLTVAGSFYSDIRADQQAKSLKMNQWQRLRAIKAQAGQSLRRYYQVNGSYPDTISELIPRYLPVDKAEIVPLQYMFHPSRRPPEYSLCIFSPLDNTEDCDYFSSP